MDPRITIHNKQDCNVHITPHRSLIDKTFWIATCHPCKWTTLGLYLSKDRTIEAAEEHLRQTDQEAA